MYRGNAHICHCGENNPYGDTMYVHPYCGIATCTVYLHVHVAMNERGHYVMNREPGTCTVYRHALEVEKRKLLLVTEDMLTHYFLFTHRYKSLNGTYSAPSFNTNWSAKIAKVLHEYITLYPFY